MECLRVQCEALTQFLPESHLGGSAGHGHLYCDPPDAEFLLGPQDPKVAMSYHSFKKTIYANSVKYMTKDIARQQYSHL